VADTKRKKKKELTITEFAPMEGKGARARALTKGITVVAGEEGHRSSLKEVAGNT